MKKQTKKHILVEKPLCTNTKDCLEIKKLTKDYPSVFWTAMEYRYMPPVSKFINEIHNNKIGDLKTLTIREHRFPFLKKVCLSFVCLQKILTCKKSL